MPLLCNSIFAMSLARSFLSDPHGMIFIHASCDQPLMNSPITKLSFVILSEVEESLKHWSRYLRYGRYDRFAKKTNRGSTPILSTYFIPNLEIFREDNKIFANYGNKSTLYNKYIKQMKTFRRNLWI